MIHALVADTRSIRVFEASGRTAAPAEVAVLRNPDAGRHERDRVSDGLVLVAAPRMLANLRRSLPASMRKRVASEMPLDLSHSSAANLRKRLGPAMAAAARKVR